MNGCWLLSDEEVQIISRSFGGTFGKRNKALFVVGYRTGFRISELLSLRVGDVQQHGKIVDHMTVQRKHMKECCLPSRCAPWKIFRVAAQAFETTEAHHREHDARREA
jgi:site-specific recombinase XerD